MMAGVFPAGGNPLGGVAGFAGGRAGRTGAMTGTDVIAGGLADEGVDGVGVGVGVGLGAAGCGFAWVWANASGAARLDKVNAERVEEKKRKETAVPRRTHFRFVEDSGTICNDVGMIEPKNARTGDNHGQALLEVFDFHYQPIRIHRADKQTTHDEYAHSNHSRC